MAAIIYDNFGGIIPKVDPKRLPAGSATRAHNVELSSGKLEPMSITAGFQTNHEADTGRIKPQIPLSELIAIPEPDKPTLLSKYKMASPESWTWNIVGAVFIEWYDENGARQTDSVGFTSFVYYGIEYVNDGFLLKYSLGRANRTLQPGFYYKVYGPHFGFSIDSTPNYSGGPNEYVAYPDPLAVSITSPTYPLISTPLYAPIDYSAWNGTPTQSYVGTKYVYGTLNLIDYSGPIALSEVDLTLASASQDTNLSEAGLATFYFQINYSRSQQQFVRYATQAVDTSYTVAGDVGREGPVSDESDIIVVQPGEIVKLSVPLPVGYTKQIVYRTSPDGTYRELDDEVEASVYFDDFNNSLKDELGTYGNFPHADAATARIRSLLIGGRMGVLIYGEELWASEPDKLWIYPKEYAFPMFAPILCGVGFVSSIIVFTGENEDGEPGKVYRVGGQHPQYWSRQLLSECKPLLNEKSVCTIDSTVFYVSEDGLIAVGPDGSIQNISDDYYNREDWYALRPQFFKSYIRDSSIFLVHEGPDPIHLRFDLNDAHCKLTTFDAFSGKPGEWTGREETSYHPISFRAMQVHADAYPVDVTLTGNNDDAISYDFSVNSSKAFLLPRMARCKSWQLSVSTAVGTVDRVAVATSLKEINK